ncbi:MAG: LuxR C-terminal-related transcriptional regulator [Chloroflexota bacterium]
MDGDRLVLASDDESSITVGTPAWFDWLESATTFAFTSPSGRFTARKEARTRGGLYWKAYHTVHGALHRAYLGKSSDLTLDCLTKTAATVSATSARTGPSTSATPAPRSETTVVPTSLLTTKLNVPPARAQLVNRPRLFERLEVGLHGKLTLIAAPAGFGKTTLLSAWRTTEACNNIPFAWVSLDSTDNDPLLFWRYVFAAIDTVAPGAAASALNLLQSPNSPRPTSCEPIITILLNAIATDPSIPDSFVLVLDDYHVIDALAIGQTLTFLIEHMPPQMHLVIATREDPQLPLARFRARNQLTELRAADLRFAPSEAAGFLTQVMGLDLSADDVDALETRTEGWIAGLQLAALALRDSDDHTRFIRTFTGSSRFIIDYLAEEVLERQPEVVRAFLLRTSVLERMCAPLCDAVLNGNLDRNSEPESQAAPDSPQEISSQVSSQAMLERLERSNLFIVPLDNERRWYRYHHLFADLLRQRLLQSAHQSAHQSIASSATEGRESVAELHIRASQWYQDNGLELEAFQHAVAANDIERTERLIEGEGVPLHFRGAGAPVLNWLGSLPVAVLNARPSLWVTYASALMMTGQHTAVEEKLQAAEAALDDQQGFLQGIELGDTTRDVVGRIASLRATLAVNQHDVEALLAQSQRALDYLHPHNLPMRTAANFTLGHAYQLQGNRAAASRAYAEVIAISKSFGPSIYTTAATLCLGQVQETENELHLAAETYRRVILLAGDPPRPIACEAHLGLARIYYQWNDLDAAEEHGQQGVQLAQQMDSVDTIAACGVLRARLKLAQADVAGAVTILQEAEEFIRRNNFVFRMPDVVAAQVLTLLAQGNLTAAAHLAETHELPMSQARVYLVQGDTLTAMSVLEPLRRQMEANDWADERLKVMVLEVVALHLHGEKSKAVQVLEDALALAKPGGFIRIFVDEGNPMRQLLAEAVTRGIMPEYTGKLLAVFGAEMPQKPHSKDTPFLPFSAALSQTAPTTSARLLIEPLSQRELEVLQLMTQGLSNHEISQQLFLALSTVKGHNRIIFGKLQVQRRTEAVARAHELGLLGRT